MIVYKYKQKQTHKQNGDKEMNERMMKKVFDDLRFGDALRSLKTIASLSDARIAFMTISKKEPAYTINSDVASYFKKNGFIVVNDGVGYKISQK